MTIHVVSPSIFESFNARVLEPEQVARTFVPSLHYNRLANRTHTVIVGPRGSGKTTLLKMLQQPALESWRHPQADKLRSRIDFTGVFIATDVSWGAQVHALGNGRLDTETHRVFSEAAVTTHVIRSLIGAMHYRTHAPQNEQYTPHRRVSLSNVAETQLSKGIASLLYLNPVLPTLASLKHALSARLSQIHENARRETYLGEKGRQERLGAHQYLHLHFAQAASAATELFQDFSGSPPEKWALLFDELEIAPQWIREELLRSLRSVDSRLLFKLSMSPYTEDALHLTKAISAMPGNDYEAIPLWYAHKEDGHLFSRELWDSMLKERNIPPQEPDSLLGRSEFDTPSNEWTHEGTAYSPGSRLQKRIARMAREDPSFHHYLSSRNINPQKLHELESSERADGDS